MCTVKSTIDPQINQHWPLNVSTAFNGTFPYYHSHINNVNFGGIIPEGAPTAVLTESNNWQTSLTRLKQASVYY